MFQQFLKTSQARVELALEERLTPCSDDSARLMEAMRYSVLNGGKRVRALLAYAAAQAVGDPNQDTLDALACAIECIHGYSLIHDDLPAMDDDELRRGRPSCHIAFGEATAILAGDALQAEAFRILSDPDLALSSDIKVQLVQELALASGAHGMVLGQAVDLNAVSQSLTQPALETMHQLKTGALIVASVRIGALAAGANRHQLQQLDLFARCVGLSFQVKDDVLDVTADTQTLGKPQGADADMNKPTFVSLLGLEQAQQYSQSLHHQALDALASFDYRADNLRHISGYIVNRAY